jgi:Zn-dependent protease with chaperone function
MSDKLIYKHEPALFWILFVVSLICWLALIGVTFGIVLLFVPVMFLIYLFGQSALISHLRGSGALISANQFPDLNERVQACAKKRERKKAPAAYIRNGNGIFNAFATQFLRRHYIVLLSSVVDALHDNPDGLNFYIGHELGHIKRRHLPWSTFLAPGSILPLAGAAYFRAREYTCDRHGAACCEQPQSAQQALAVLAVGGSRWKDINLKNYIGQIRDTKGFWMSFHELLASYPWLTKRVARVSPEFPQDKMPGRNIFAYILCLFIPRPSLVTLLIIYGGLAAGGVLKGQDLVKEAQARHNAAAFSTTLEQMRRQAPADNSPNEQGPAIPGAPVMPGVPDSGYAK